MQSRVDEREDDVVSGRRSELAQSLSESAFGLALAPRRSSRLAARSFGTTKTCEDGVLVIDYDVLTSLFKELSFMVERRSCYIRIQ